MVDFVPTPRRGRPPLARAEDDGQTVESTSRRRRSDVGGLSLKLTAPSRPGFVRRWFNDDNNRIADADALAYDFVTEEGVQSTGPDSRIKRLVGNKANGEPLHAYLMETPEDEFAYGLAEKEAHNRKVDEAIRDGRDSTGQHQSDGYVGEGSIKVG